MTELLVVIVTALVVIAAATVVGPRLGFVAAVVAGLVAGIRARRDLSPLNRLSDSRNRRTVELVLEGAIFLTMGLQLKGIVTKTPRRASRRRSRR